MTGIGSSIRFTTFGILDNNSTLFDVTFGTWIHVAVTYNNGAISYFLNGDPIGSSTSAFGNESAAGRLIIGSRFGGNDVDQMNGQLDGIQVYDTVLSQAAIRQAAVSSVSAIPEPSIGLLGLAAAVGLPIRRRAKRDGRGSGMGFTRRQLTFIPESDPLRRRECNCQQSAPERSSAENMISGVASTTTTT